MWKRPPNFLPAPADIHRKQTDGTATSMSSVALTMPPIVGSLTLPVTPHSQRIAAANPGAFLHGVVSFHIRRGAFNSWGRPNMTTLLAKLDGATSLLSLECVLPL